MLHRLRYVFSKNRSYGESEINFEQLEKMVEKGALLIDVRSPQEFAEGHLENAILLPEYEIKQKIEQIATDKAQVMVVYCSTGHRGIKAQKLLQRLGYKEVYNLQNGLENSV